MKTHTNPPVKLGSIRRARRSGGFTLLEVIFAMAILAIGLLAVAALLPVAAIQQKRALDNQLGTSFGQGAISAIKAAGRNSFFSSAVVYSSTDSPYIDDDIKFAYKVTDSSNVFDYRVSYSMANATAPINLSVFVYRKAPNSPDPKIKQNTVATHRVQVADDVANNRTAIAGTSSFVAPITATAPGTTYADIYRKNAVILIVNTNVTPYRTYVARVTTEPTATGANAYISPMIGEFTNPTDCVIYCLTDNNISGSGFNYKPTELKAVAVVQGVIP